MIEIIFIAILIILIICFIKKSGGSFKKNLQFFLYTCLLPIIFIVVELIMTIGLVKTYNSNLKNDLTVNNPTLLKEEIDVLFNNLILTDNYTQELNNYVVQYSLIVIILLFIIFMPIFIKKTKAYFKNYNEQLKIKQALKVVLCGICFSLACNIILFNINNLYHFTNNFKSTNYVLISFLTTCLLGPIIEEFMFRGYVYNNLKSKFTMMASIMVSVCLFSLMHTDLMSLVYSFGFGFIAIYLYEKYHTISAPIIFHITANSAILFFMPVLLKNILWLNFLILGLALVYLVLMLDKKNRNV